jgi:hypothetical protein
MYVIVESDGIQWVFGEVSYFGFDVEKKLLIVETEDGKIHRVENVMKFKAMKESPNIKNKDK